MVNKKFKLTQIGIKPANYSKYRLYVTILTHI